MTKRCAAFGVLAWTALGTAQSRPADIPFKIHPIDPGASETAAVIDINRDGRLDVVSGENWYEAPQGTGRASLPWTKHRFRDLGFSNNYIDAFSDLPVDVDGDGFPDIATVTWFAKKISWWKNPGRQSDTAVARGFTPATPTWAETVINAGFNVEFAVLADVDNDGHAREIVAQENGTGQSWYEVADKKWVKRVISDRSYGHGIGVGDVNGDKRNDILTPRGWLEAPANPRTAGWTYHAAWESVNTPITPRETQTPPQPGSPPRIAELGFIHVMDVNGDGRNDVITAAGHDYGVYWFEQGANDQWTRRTIDNAWSQGHTSTLIDLNGDGRLDFVTGKRFMAHNGSDPGEREPLGVYWYELSDAAKQAGRVEWIRHVIDYSSRVGAGMQLPVADIDGDGDLDLVCPGKSGLFLLENLTKKTKQGE
jgi:VCBS repeat protein